METQMKRGLLDVCVLKALEAEDSYGYQIIKDISPYIAISESTLYPILRRLEADHYLTVYSAEHNGRCRPAEDQSIFTGMGRGYGYLPLY